MFINNMFRVYGVSEGKYITDNSFMMHPDGYLVRLIDGTAVKQDPLLYKVERAAVLRQDRIYFHNDVVDVTTPKHKWLGFLVHRPCALQTSYSISPGVDSRVPHGMIRFYRTAIRLSRFYFNKENNNDAAMPEM